MKNRLGICILFTVIITGIFFQSGSLSKAGDAVISSPLNSSGKIVYGGDVIFDSADLDTIKDGVNDLGETVDQNCVDITELNNSLTSLVETKYDDVSGKPMWKEKGADTWNFFSGGFDFSYSSNGQRPNGTTCFSFSKDESKITFNSSNPFDMLHGKGSTNTQGIIYSEKAIKSITLDGGGTTSYTTSYVQMFYSVDGNTWISFTSKTTGSISGTHSFNGQDVHYIKATLTSDYSHIYITEIVFV